LNFKLFFPIFSAFWNISAFRKVLISDGFDSIFCFPFDESSVFYLAVSLATLPPNTTALIAFSLMTYRNGWSAVKVVGSDQDRSTNVRPGEIDRTSEYLNMTN
jgi:hypothetical protein